MKQLPTVPAPAGLARRSFLTALAVTVPLAATVATPALAAVGASRSKIDELYEERTELAARSRLLQEQLRAATASMPWWAQAGHEYLRGDVTWTGGIVGWPAIDDDRKPSQPTRTYMVQKRPSPHTILKDFEFDLRFFGEERRPEIRATYRRRMRELVARLRRQRDEEAKAGLAAISAQLDTLGERLSELDEQIEELDVSGADAAQKAAAVILVTALYAHWRNDDHFGDTSTLVALRELLSGQIREHVDYVIDHPDHEMWAMPFYSAA